jgi:hypothetical protein
MQNKVHRLIYSDMWSHKERVSKYKLGTDYTDLIDGNYIKNRVNPCNPRLKKKWMCCSTHPHSVVLLGIKE